ncbi:UDP-glucosyltransferase [Populus alba x Populus x berolinensis]|nr:UDP-glucosyltransferase [Populus alba x Populus x berolinensis]
MIAEQSLNAKLIVDGLGAGLSVKRVQNQGSEILVSRQAISEGQKGRSARERAEALGRVARRAVQKDGSSHDTLSKLIDHLRAY